MKEKQPMPRIILNREQYMELLHAQADAQTIEQVNYVLASANGEGLEPLFFLEGDTLKMGFSPKKSVGDTFRP